MTGVNLMYESAGMHASLLGFCLESLLIDNDMLGAINRNVRGIEVNEDTLSVDVIREVCLNGPGHFLGSDQTLMPINATGDARATSAICSTTSAMNVRGPPVAQ